MTQQSSTEQAANRAGRFGWRTVAGCVLLALGVLAVTVLLPVFVRGQMLVLPLDDVYIHFQYARGIASGEPYVYNPGLPPSSGATSLLYPYLLAVGYAAGLTGLSLGWWALALGTGALAASVWVMLHLARAANLWPGGAWLLAVTFALTGGISWHYMSGMETGLLVLFMLATLYAVITRRFWPGVAAAALMAVTRPEGAIMAVVFSGVMLLRWWVTWRGDSLRLIGAGLPVAALGVQPLVNWMFTGSTQAAGSSAKSLLSMVPADANVIAGQVTSNFGRMWWELLTGYSGREGLYLPVGLAVLAAVGWWRLAVNRRRWDVGLMTLGWLLGGTLAVATLDPSFWHFKRYQMPFMALLFPLAAWGIAWPALYGRVWLRRGVWALLLISALGSGVLFWRSYQLNTGYLRAQQIPMAQWLRANTPDDAVIAVHDVGLMRYLGERTTLDMVGLTTPGAADSWRNGPGAVAEFMASYTPRPGYVASYTDALGLSYLADTGLYGEELAAFPVQPSDRYNVALAGAYQGVWRIDWTTAEAAGTPKQPYPRTLTESLQLVDTVDVADLDSEAAHAYTWSNDERLPGFPTEVYEMDYAACDADVCTVLDGGRRINGTETFTLATTPGEDLLLVTRVHPAAAGAYTVFVGGEPVATRTLPAMPGRWLDIPVQIDAGLVSEQTQVRIVPDVPGSHYMPYMHWAYQGNLADSGAPDDPVAAFGDAVELATLDMTHTAERLTVDINMRSQVAERGDYRVFLHVYDDIGAPPVAQADRYPLDGATPPGNWLPGEVQDGFMVDLKNLSVGAHTVALGFYDPATGERLQPTSDRYRVLDDGRLLLGEINIDG